MKLIEGYAYKESSVWWEYLVDSKSFLSQNTGIGICHDVNMSELGVMFDVLKLCFLCIIQTISYFKWLIS